MLEPLASSVLTSFLSIRPSVATSNSSQLALRTMTRTLSANFFTPHPRRAKGKERANAGEDCTACGSNCLGSGPALSPSDVRAPLTRATLPSRQRLRRLSPQRPFADAPRGRIPAIHGWNVGHNVVQRRHASSQPKDGPEPPKNPGVETWRREIFEATQKHNVVGSAWNAYVNLRANDALKTLGVGILLTFADKMVIYAQTRRVEKDSNIETEWELWGRRVQNLLHHMEHRIPDDDNLFERRRWQVEMARVLALRGRLEESIAMARRVHLVEAMLHERKYIVAMHRSIVVALRQFRGPTAVLEYVIHEWDAIGTYLEKRSVLVEHRSTTIKGVDELQRYVFKVVSRIDSPVVFLNEIETKWAAPRRQRVGEFLIDVYTSHNHPHEAAAVLGELYRQHLHVPGYQQLSLVRALAKAGSFQLANPMFDALENSLRDPHGQLERQRYETGLYLFARQGDIERTKEYFKACRNEGSNDSRAIAQVLHAHAVRGDPSQAVAFFNEYCYEGREPKPNQIRANIVHYTAVISAHARHGDRDGMNVWLEKMSRAGWAPDMAVYNIILQAFASDGEIISVGAVLDQMRASGNIPDRISYTIVISALASRRDPVAAEAIYKQAVGEGVIPDRQMMTALLNAHVEAGSWLGVINAFDYLVAHSRKRKLDLSIEVYNTLLKAYVLISAPFHVVFRHFYRLQAMNVRPDARTYALVIQSACDSGNMEMAEKLYNGVERMAKHWKYGIQLNAYLLTIMLSGFLRDGNQKKAKLVYQSMITLGIQPTSITFHTIIKAYANSKSEESIQVALAFVKDLMEVDSQDQNWLRSSSTYGSEMDHIYGPLLGAYTRMKRPEELERLLQELFDRGGAPTLYNLAALLDVYRRTDNVEGAREVWPQIYQLGLEISKVDALFVDKQAPKEDFLHPGSRRQGNVLSIPLSMYIDVMSASGLHTEIAKTWQQMQEAGFTFDGHNWNHLAVALTRAGEPVRAFEVLERVLLPYSDAVNSLSEDRDQEPSSPLLTDREISPAEVQPPAVWPLHDSMRRAHLNKRFRRVKALAKGEHNRPEDFAHQLHILRQISPLWRSWKPHTVTLEILALVLGHLHSGNIIQALRPTSTDSPPAPTMQQVEERQARADEILERIYEQCPRAVQHVNLFRARHRKNTSAVRLR